MDQEAEDYKNSFNTINLFGNTAGLESNLDLQWVIDQATHNVHDFAALLQGDIGAFDVSFEDYVNIKPEVDKKEATNTTVDSVLLENLLPREEADSFAIQLTGDNSPSSNFDTGSYIFADTTFVEAEKASRKRRKQSATKDSDEYRTRRQRNNVAVRKSRDKAKQRQAETENAVKVLKEENSKLKKQLGKVQHELNFLRGLFSSAQIRVSKDVENQLQLYTLP